MHSIEQLQRSATTCRHGRVNWLDDVNWVATPKAQHSWNFKILHNIHYAKFQGSRPSLPPAAAAAA
jgi:hypothetical protein